MGNFNELLPRDKFDFERINEIKLMRNEDVIPLLPDLLEWIQDMNWPIAFGVVEVLSAYPQEIVPHIKRVFLTEDAVWKYWCLEQIVKDLPIHEKKLLSDDLIRMSETPTRDEQLEEVDQSASEILSSM
ncbi:DUF5071 domain-containing protein [Sporosarcina sp. GW1-11]|uniref:DUF5071 domain-containing protein n=1 Tax=Sporosarcina sp. GW1-11 TaxID=2899126 RepID=UPI00294C3330|nr:DUF5071 domain-containing protein [Sporosarcina sp. GW1-11]MDV6379477.1 DUF5071 domain-containing protein [Sporosarcina sp. GW1-11]